MPRKEADNPEGFHRVLSNLGIKVKPSFDPATASDREFERMMKRVDKAPMPGVKRNPI